ncbi:uncharacterized protein LOC110452482 [Mizuhopecten yessoensis]|uniref:Uncharacterized protein n=1 Tax=Mizuhopecten yessoensis TaxID=6573 RepID=A0A210QJE8_MIZYE|nr:uncharacterized protein LOC110452482 [Mizuhopecten yessoensis]OWF48839.1 hypothetical protein KP79_PYT08773 [Mizuhopecten yessoensis]
MFFCMIINGSCMEGNMMDFTSNLRLRIRTNNHTMEAVVESIRKSDSDDIGALYYVVAVVFIYGFSIVMMIASHIRKNKQDNQLRVYLKEMALLRKNDRREKLVGTLSSFTTKTNIFAEEFEKKKIPKLIEGVNEERQDLLFCANSTSDDTNDSGLQLNYDEDVESPPKTCESQNSKQSSVLVHVINEQTSL